MPPTKFIASEKAAPAAPLGAVQGSGRGVTSIALERVLPNSQDAEMAVLGAMLLSPLEAASKVRERLTDEHFYYAAHQVIFREIAALQDAMQAVDMITVTQRLQDRNQLDGIGGPAFLTDLITRVPTTANVDHYVDIVWEKFLLRQLINSAHDIMARSFEPQDDVQAWVDEVEQQIFNITAERSTSSVRLMKELTKSAMDDIERLYEQRGTIPGLSTGIRDLDKITSGLHPGNMVVIAGRPSMGKTALALNIAEHVAVELGKPVGVFSLEMSADELVKRLLCSRARVNLRTIQNGFPRDTDHHALTATASQLMKCPLHIDDTASLTVNQVRSRARRMRLQFGIELLVIDYLQLMRAPSRRADSSRQAEVTDISSGIKALAKELGIPVIVLSQLNRQPEARDEGKPRLSDLRESGSIEQDADVVGLLVRPEVYEDDKEARDQKKGQATLIIAKQRNGPTGDVELIFLQEFTRFENASRVGDEDLPELERSGE